MKNGHLILCGLSVLLVSGCCEMFNSCPDLCTDNPNAIECYAPTHALLTIDPIAQETDIWSWAASAEMVLRHYDLPNVNQGANYQCGVVAVYAFLLQGIEHRCVYDCHLCVEPIRSLEEFQSVINGYGQVSRQHGIPSGSLTSRNLSASLSLQELAKELDEGRPVVAGISFLGGLALPDITEHTVVIVGYDTRSTEPVLLINDPFPYDSHFSTPANPYLAAGGTELLPGRYSIPLSEFNRQMIWESTLFEIK